LTKETVAARKGLDRGKSNEILRQREVQRKSNPVPYSSSVAVLVEVLVERVENSCLVSGNGAKVIVGVEVWVIWIDV